MFGRRGQHGGGRLPSSGIGGWTTPLLNFLRPNWQENHQQVKGLPSSLPTPPIYITPPFLSAVGGKNPTLQKSKPRNIHNFGSKTEIVMDWKYNLRTMIQVISWYSIKERIILNIFTLIGLQQCCWQRLMVNIWWIYKTIFDPSTPTYR